MQCSGAVRLCFGVGVSINGLLALWLRLRRACVTDKGGKAPTPSCTDRRRLAGAGAQLAAAELPDTGWDTARAALGRW